MRAIRNRIRSIESTRQITRSMRMVAASKLRKTQERWLKIRDFAALSREVLQRLCESMDAPREPLLQTREEGPLVLVLFVGNRGLCGTYNSALVKAAEERIAAEEGEVKLVVCGRWGREQIAALGVELLQCFDEIDDTPTAEQAKTLANFLRELFLSGGARCVELMYEQYCSALSQKPRCLPLLPLQSAGERHESELIFEPDADTLLAELSSLVLQSSVYATLLEAKTGEHTARMTAMSAASDNTDELIAKLTLQLNHARQAAITTEIAEIVGGSNALNQNEGGASWKKA